jgi:hypothetical protein
MALYDRGGQLDEFWESHFRKQHKCRVYMKQNTFDLFDGSVFLFIQLQ